MTTRKTIRSESVRVDGTISYSDIEDIIDRMVPDAPPNATVTIKVNVPGGGDWSNTTLEDPEIGFTISWERSEEQ